MNRLVKPGGAVAKRMKNIFPSRSRQTVPKSLFINDILPRKEVFYQNKHRKRVLATSSQQRGAPTVRVERKRRINHATPSLPEQMTANEHLENL
jgi:hypothetical protein